MPVRKRHHHTAQYGSGGGGKGVPFSPTQISGLVGWYKADAIAQADASAVTSWTDSSGAGNTLVQAVGAAQPTLQTNELNAKSIVRFDGSDQLSTVAYGAALAQPSTAFVVGQSTPTGGINQAFIDGIVHPDRYLFRYSQTTAYSMYAGGSVASGGTPDASFHIMVPVFSGATSKLWVDGSSINLGGTDIGASALGGLRVGSNAGLDEPLIGDIAEVLLYNAAVSNANINLIANYLASKYALTWAAI